MRNTIDELSDEDTSGDVYLITLFAENDEEKAELKSQINRTLALVGYIPGGGMIQFRIDIGRKPSAYQCFSSRQHP